MKSKTIYITLIFCLLFFLTTTAHCQKRTYSYGAEIGGSIPSPYLPFWLYTNQYGKITDDSYLWGNVGLLSDFRKTNTRTFDFAFGFEGTASLGKNDNRIYVDQLFGRIRWQNLVLNAGILHRPVLYDGLSASNGDMLYSNNSRSMPGICLSTWDYIKFPWIGKWVAFKAKYAEYTMTDNRYMGNRTRLHNKLLAGRLTIIPQLSIEGGIEDYSQWGGTDPDKGKVSYTFKDYVKMVLIKSGGSDASWSDQVNKLGNHIGMHFAKVNFHNTAFGLELYYNHMFEDGSGMRFQNWPDGLYGLYFTRKKSSLWFKSFVYEFYYTKDQSGPDHDRPATPKEIAQKEPGDPFPDRIVLGGNDSYFNHGEYRSGWTFHHRTIGTPFFTPYTYPGSDMTFGTYNNRFVAHHIGICGDLPIHNIHYKLMCSYSQNYGTHSNHFINENNESMTKKQFSSSIEFTLPESKLPFGSCLNIGFDKGDLLRNNFGIMLKIFKTGLF